MAGQGFVQPFSEGLKPKNGWKTFQKQRTIKEKPGPPTKKGLEHIAKIMEKQGKAKKAKGCTTFVKGRSESKNGNCNISVIFHDVSILNR